MSIFDDLLKATDQLNDPGSGATVKWRHQLTDPNRQNSADVQARAQLLGVVDDAFHAERQQFKVFTDQKVQVEFVTLVEGYLQMTHGLYTFLLKFGSVDKGVEEKVTDALKEVKGLARGAQASLKVEPQPDNLFLKTMQPLIGVEKVIEGVKFPVITQEDYSLTQKLFKRERFSLDERERFSLDDDGTIKKLIDSWETVIAFFVNTNKSTPNYPGANAAAIALAKAKAEAEFFTMHGLLEVLYDRLEANRRTGIDILSPII